MLAVIRGLFAITWLRRSVAAVVFMAVGYFGVTRAVDRVTDTIDRAAKYDAAQTTINELNLEMAAQDERHAAERARLEADRVRIDENYRAFRNRAYEQINRLKEVTDNDPQSKAWASLPIPDSVRRLRDERQTAAGTVYSELPVTNGAAGGDNPATDADVPQ